MKTSPSNFRWNLRVALSLTQGGVTLNDGLLLLTRITKFLLSALWQTWLGHQGPLLHRFDSGNFVLISGWVLQNKTFE